MIRRDGRTMIGKVASTFHPAPSSLPFLIVLSVPEICLIPCKLLPRQCRSIFVIGSSPVAPAPPALFPGPLFPRSLPNTTNSASRYNPMLPRGSTLCRHPVQRNPATGSPSEYAASSTQKACGNVYQTVTDGLPVMQAQQVGERTDHRSHFDDP